MTAWNRIAIEHWVNRKIDEDKVERKEHTFSVYLGFSVIEGAIPRDRAIASGFPVWFPKCRSHASKIRKVSSDILPDEIIIRDTDFDNYSYDDKYLDSDFYFYDISNRIKCIEIGHQNWLTGEFVKSKIPYPYPFRVIVDDYWGTIQRCDVEETVLPGTGIYVYYHPYEGYKIGQAENIPRRMEKHWTSAPASTLLHIIETSDLDWCERFVHKRYDRYRRHRNHEYFDLDLEHLAWLFGLGELNPPRSIGDQLSLLDVL